MSTPSPNVLLKNENDVIIFVSCICGVLGFILICAIIGFFWELCRCGAKRKRSNNGFLKQTHGNISNQQVHKDCGNHYPTWLYNTMVHEHAHNMATYLQNGSPSEKKPPSHDPEGYINEVFSDIFDETNEPAKVGKGVVAYQGANKIITPDKKPVPVPYFPKEANTKNNEIANGHLKVSLESEKMELHKEKASGGKAIPLDDFDLDLFEMGEPEASTDPTKIIFPKELTVGEKIRARHNQAVEYENPKILEKERKDRLREEQKQEEMRAKRIILERTTSDLKFATPEIVKPTIRIPAGGSDQAWPSMDENNTKDSFLY